MDAGAGHPGGLLSFAEAMIDRSAGVMIGGTGLTIELPGGARVQAQSPLQLGNPRIHRVL
jgi:hypothetical protein